jgi:hypothetical protein
MDKKISEYTEKMAGTFLFWAPKGEGKEKPNRESLDAYSQFMDMRTRVVNLDMLRVLIYYGTMSKHFKIESAEEAKNLIERLLIGIDGGGRSEAVETLRQQFAKKVEVEMGKEKGLED